LLKEAGYDGTPVVILQPTDTPSVNTQPVVIGQALRSRLQGGNAGHGLADRGDAPRQPGASQEGGWNIFATNNVMAEASDPLRAFRVAANGKGAWFGWPDVPEIERLRIEFSRTAEEAKRKQLAGQIQKLVIAEGVLLPWASTTCRPHTATASAAHWKLRFRSSGMSEEVISPHEK
jgi:peptide/nickel transport system substrate-binding protein